MLSDSDTDDWRLRLVGKDDIDDVHALLSKPLVYQFLCDGAAPDKTAVAEDVARSTEDAANFGVGLWVLEKPQSRCGGCVQLKPDISSKTAELSYYLDPKHWHKGLATRMGWTAVVRAFQSPSIDYVFAGADLPNKASFEVMCRLGMRFRQNVQYPLGGGAEYGIYRNDKGPDTRPALLPFDD